MKVLLKLKDLAASSVVAILVLATVLVGFASVAGYLSQYAQALELLSHLRFIYVSALALLCGILLTLKKSKLALLPAAFIGVNLFAILPFYFPSGESCPSQTGPRIKVFSANLWGGKNTNYTATIKSVHAANPDIVGFSEVTRTWIEKLETGLPEYPYKVVEPHVGGIALFSKVPLHEGQILYSSPLKRPRVEAKISFGGRDVKVIVAHPFVPDYRFALRNNEFSEIAGDIRRSNEPAILCGDLNCTPWSYYFTKLQNDGNLVDSESGFGIQPSWGPKVSFKTRPKFGLPAILPIDHCLATKDFVAIQRSVGPAIGSDHLPITAELCLRD